MFEDLKRQVAAGSGRERARLMVGVALCVILGTTIYAGSRFGARTTGPSTVPEEVETATPVEPLRLDRDELAKDAEGDEPFRWSVAAFLRVDAALKAAGALPIDDGPQAVDELVAHPFDTLRGEFVQVRGEVVALAQEGFLRDGRPAGPGEDPARVLQIAVLRGRGGGHVLLARPTLRDDILPGQPFLYETDTMRAMPLRIGDVARARGIVVQQRQGTFENVAVADPSPALFALQFRQDVAPDERLSTIQDPSEADWEDVLDRTWAETRVWGEPAMLQVVRWAREVGPAELAARIRDGRLPWTVWDQDTFSRWGAEVDATEGERPFTEGARGKVFRLDVMIGSVIQQGWAQIPANREGIDDLLLWDVMADRYYNRVLRTFVPFPTDAFPPLKGRRKEHVHLYGMFVKNWTYEMKVADPVRKVPMEITVPTFVVLHAEPHPEGADLDSQRVLGWILLGLLSFALLFYWVVARPARRAERHSEEHRLALKQRRRKTAGPTPERDPGPA